MKYSKTVNIVMEASELLESILENGNGRIHSTKEAIEDINEMLQILKEVEETNHVSKKIENGITKMTSDWLQETLKGVQRGET